MSEPLWRPVAGKYGRTRDGRMVGPLYVTSTGCRFRGDCQGNERTYHADGSYTNSDAPQLDLVAEWSSEPPLAEQWRKLGPDGPMTIIRDDPAPAQPIDVHEVVAGDILDVRVKVDRIENGRPVAYSAHAPGQARVADVYPEDIIRHMPMRQFIEEGCTVALDGGGRGKVLKTWEGMAWVIRLRNGSPESCTPRTWPFDRLQRIDGGGA